MVDPDGILVIIPARGGSKRLPRKNILPLAGKPLICWSIESALEAALGARIVVTSDDDEILALAGNYSAKGVFPHRRPCELATDNASTVDVILDVVNAEIGAGHAPRSIVLLQPTSPLRTAEDIHAALQVYRNGESEDTVVTVCEVDHPTAWIGTISQDLRLEGLDFSGKRSQDYPKEYRLNGAVYVASVDTLFEKNTIFTGTVRASIMPRKRSFDVDEEMDMQLCEALLAQIARREIP